LGGENGSPLRSVRECKRVRGVKVSIRRREERGKANTLKVPHPRRRGDSPGKM